ncbi:MAG: MFS transporter, partial [Streptosporangiales bacterium]|nr:MFS transporter [Streptosporangiales bacterium]
ATGRYKIFPILGTGIACVGLGLLSRMSVTSTRFENGVYMFVLGFGIGLVMQVLILIVQNGASSRDLGASTAAANYFRQIGGTVGSGIVGAVFASRLTSKLKETVPPSLLAHTSSGGAQSLTPKMLDAMPPELKHIFVAAYAYALPPIFLYLVPIMVIGFIASLFVKEVRLRTTMGDTEEVAEQADAVGLVAEPTPAQILAHAEEQAQDGGQVSGQPVFGRVLHANGTPVPGATVTLIGAAGRQAGRASSGPDGAYRLGVAEPGAYTLIAMAPGCQPHAAAVTAGTRPAQADIRLQGASRLAGTVRSRAGDPLPAVTLTLADSRGEVVATAQTGAKGDYRLDNLVAGPYTLAAAAAGWRPAALPVTLADGEESLADIELRGGARVSGAARAGAGTAVPDARVTLLDPDGNVAGITATGTDGTYTFENVGEGDYTVIAAGYPPAASRLKVTAGETHSHDVTLGHPED